MTITPIVPVVLGTCVRLKRNGLQHLAEGVQLRGRVHWIERGVRWRWTGKHWVHWQGIRREW